MNYGLKFFGRRNIQVNVLSTIRKNEAVFRRIMVEFQKDVEKTGATSVTEVDWNPDSEVFFYSLIGPKARASRNFNDVKVNVFAKLMSEFRRFEAEQKC